MALAERVVTAVVRRLVRILCRVDAAQLQRVPPRGPLIMVGNHVNFLDVPVLYTHLQPRPLAGAAKVETWDNPLLGRLFDLWQIFPIRRGEADVEAFRKALAVLAEGRILGILPEGTRSGDGRLQRGRPGMVAIALRSGAPILPFVLYGAENIWRDLSRLRRPHLRIAVGRPFALATGGVKVTAEVRQQIADEIMLQLAALLPAAYRGCYADLDAAAPHYLRFIDQL